ncbi:hypothetical protein SEA_ARCHERNM_9 [Mycobacterium phage ArcherNM]|uniref:hypothetical protein n=1 Tax=Mycobacterium phage ArcherNM TaxID=1815972 RepID=UPI00078B19F5|nr:hypothetical protein BJD71_gp09 [Mycobacterium phage ArcherNM]AMS01003.1 hypothetical protein SEA_ARCHERNM_9 [Mycobacterium phage ArcherNM]
MNPDDHYTFAVMYEGLPDPEGEWVQYISVCADLAEAQIVYDTIGPFLEENPLVRNFMLAYTPKANWQPYTV